MRDPNVPTGLRAVAVFELTKGILVLLVGFGVLAFVHKNYGDIGQHLIEVLRVHPEGKLSNIFLNLANHITDKTLWVLAFGALLYATVRFIEAYGLWQGRDWAQWFALLSGALYLPGELYSLVRHASPLKWAVLVTNLLIVLFMLTLRIKENRRGNAKA